MTEPVRVARIIARLNVGGPARHVVWLTEALNDARFASILVTGRIPPGEQDMSDFATAAGVNPIVIGEMSRAISWRDAIVVWKLLRILLRFRPDIVHTHTAKAGTVGRVAALLYRVIARRHCRVVHTFHGHVFHSYYGRFATSLFLVIERTLARFTDRIIVLSERQLDEIHRVFRVGRREQFQVVPLGLDLTQFESEVSRDAARRELGIGSDDRVIGIVGRLTEVKDHAFFLQAVAAWIAGAAELARGVRFVIVGDGHLRPQLESMAAGLGLRDRVVFAGARSDPQVFYRAMDLFVLTSKNEGTPLTMLEAMACRLPVLSTCVGGVPDLIGACRTTHGAVSVCERGLTIERGDVAGFGEALSLLLTDEDVRHAIAAAGHRFVTESFGKERLIRTLGDLYVTLKGG